MTAIRTSHTSTASRAARVTPKQREILQLLAEGRRMKEVRIILSMTARTVAFHKYNMRDTLGVTTDSELVRYAMKINLLTV
jgi:DNA-binding CsgD family transcriptional regulator